MPAKPEVAVDELSPWVGEALSSGFEIEDALVSSSFEGVSAARFSV